MLWRWSLGAWESTENRDSPETPKVHTLPFSYTRRVRISFRLIYEDIDNDSNGFIFLSLNLLSLSPSFLFSVIILSVLLLWQLLISLSNLVISPFILHFCFRGCIAFLFSCMHLHGKIFICHSATVSGKCPSRHFTFLQENLNFSVN